MNTWVLWRIAFRRLTKRRLLIASLIVAIVIVGLSSFSFIAVTTFMPVGERAPLAMSGEAFAGLYFLAGPYMQLVALIIGVSIIGSDIKDATIFPILSKPVTRGVYITAHYLASLVYILLIWMVFVALIAAIRLELKAPLVRADYFTLVSQVLFSILMLSLAFFLAQIFSPWIAGALSLAVFRGDILVTLAGWSLRMVGLRMPEFFWRVVSFPFPSTEKAQDVVNLLRRDPLDPSNVGLFFLHLVDYSLVCVILAYLVFSRRDIYVANHS